MLSSRFAGMVLGCLGCLAQGSPAQAAAAVREAPGPPPAPAPVPSPAFGDEIAVRLVTVVARVVDAAGNPVLGLGPADFRVRVGRREVPVAAVDWVGAAGSQGAAGAAAGAVAGGAGPAGDVGAAGPAGNAAPAEIAGSAPAVAPPAGPAAPAAGLAPAPALSPLSPSSPLPPPPPAATAGKLVVFFVEADNNSPPRVRGHLRTLPFTRELLDALPPEDRVAVVSFDSHLKLWQDFTRDRAAIPEAIYQAIHFGGLPPDLAGDGHTAGGRDDAATARGAAEAGGTNPAGSGARAAADDAAAAAGRAASAAPVTAGSAGAGPSLARTFDLAAAKDAASAERGLEVTAEALAPLPGEKVMVFLGWGLGTFGVMGTQMKPAFAGAARALTGARVSVFVLDVTEADSHDLEVGLRAVADATGGTFDKTNVFPALAMRQLARTISGYYVLSLDVAALPAAGGSVDVELRGRRGHGWTVLVRPTSIAEGAGGR